ncbi:protein SAAL1 [Eublepharis macularius]|uniref:Protein SAAL1 n=1 Tax=Eublepharis macularius TaxID=481883 RepID=A0AA97IXJ5_EUBMA|nr:protein SAAL1 [Eublepharis macularius]XP_054827378.1 protein SAAL1 [Eublepharis macularius]XP_054827379.1 protein SAAL1 [Eublepharis macularius]XP_054827380.1 protein SAAL1 [Eublepharis macularius]XP_054827381.1 protein SAAL1 [Eublepharis macularius]XP_054827382.1 protein SAAL1 [Eublepharis macularius]
MDRNPSPPSSDTEEEAAVADDSIGNTVYSKHWLFSVLTKLIEVISPKKGDSELNNVDVQVELDEDMENDICKVWDMSMDKDVALFLQEFKAPDIFMGVFAKSKCHRLTEICVGILGNMACCQNICVSISKDENLGQLVLQRLCDSDPPTLLETSRLLLTCLCHPEVASIWVERIRGSPSVYDCVCFIMSSSTNVELLVKVGEVVDKLFDLDEELMLNWIKSGSHKAAGQPTDDSPEELPDFEIVPCLLEAAKQVCSDNNIEGLDVYMHILQLLTTVDEGIQAIVQTTDGGKETWNLLHNVFCNELCQPDDPPIIVQEQKTVLASILSVLSAIVASQMKKEYVRIGKNMPLIVSLIRVLQNLEECGKRSADGSKEEKLEESEEDFHLKILKDICCELLSNMIQELSKENILEGLKQGHINEQKCSCAFQHLLPFYFTSVESFFEVLREADQTLADTLEKRFPSLKLQT